MENPTPKLMAYIDGSNLLERIRDYRFATKDFRFRLSPDKLADYLIEGYDLIAPIRFYATEPVRGLCTENGYRERLGLIDSFERARNYDVILRSRTKVYGKICGRPLDDDGLTRCPQRVKIPKEIDLDLHVAIDLVGDVQKYDTALLLSSDSDYTPAVAKVYDLYPEKQIVNVVLWWEKRSSQLLSACKKLNAKYFIELDPVIEKLRA